MTQLFNTRSGFGVGFPYGQDNYVPNMGLHSQVRNGVCSFTLSDGTDLQATDVDGILTGMDLDAASAETFTPANFNGALSGTGTAPFMLSAPFGQGLCVQASAATGASVAIRIRGRDWLGQRMSEEIIIGAAVTTPVYGRKAFKWIEEIYNPATATNAVTGVVGIGTIFGMPFTTVKVLAETSTVIATGVTKDETVGTLVEADGTLATSFYTGDTRGTYEPASAVDGTERIELTILCSPIVVFDSNGDQHGGLYGVPHYYA